jgi:hypothetical protein
MANIKIVGQTKKKNPKKAAVLAETPNLARKAGFLAS